jgi:glycosyltransferase involved in cell wall biosynthesis
MIVCIDASNIHWGGGLNHLDKLLRAADPQIHGFERVIIWGGSDTLASITDRDWLLKATHPWLNRALPYRILWQRFKLKRLAERARSDVLFVPGGSDASGFRPTVTMSQNLLPFDWRELRRYGWSWPAVKQATLRVTQTRTFRQADGVIFLTRYARDRVLEVTGALRGRTAVVAHGIEARFSLAPRVQRTAESFCSANPCRLLYVSTVDVYKHQWHVARAAAQLRASGVPVTLDLIGASYAPALERLNETLRQLDPEGRFIRYHGLVPHEKLHELYAAADIGVFASSCETFSHILLETMSAGLPLACSGSSAMSEILGVAGVYFDPERPDEIAAAIRGLIESPEQRATGAQAAFELARKFSWARCAGETFAFLSETCAEASGR